MAAISTIGGICISVFARYSNIVGISNPVTLREHHSGRSDELGDSSCRTGRTRFHAVLGSDVIDKEASFAAAT